MSKNISAEIDKKNVVQAILVADNFNNNFVPFSSAQSMALFPLVNVSIIDYALESLSFGGVEETFLFCCTHVDEIKEHIRDSIKRNAGWTATMKVNIIVSESCRSLGDSLRDLDAKGLLRGDFILMNADTISNVNFLPILEKHKTIAKNDKGAAMTLLLLNVGTQMNSQYVQEDVLIVSDNKYRILHHQKYLNSTLSKKINFPLEIFLENPKVSIHNNLRDTHIAICSSSVLPLFSDNFDFQTKDDFVRGLLMNEEILASTLYWHELSGNEYAARITNWNAYQWISHDVVHRWAYPLVPDMGISAQKQTYVFKRNNIYTHHNVKLGNKCKLLEDVVIDKGTSIAEQSTISRSIIGDNCKIGKNVKISDSYILPNTIIKDNSVVSYSLIGNQCTIGKGVKIVQGCIIGAKVTIKDNAELDGEILQAQSPEDSENNDKIGPNCYRVRCISKESENSDSDDEIIVKQLQRFHLGDCDEATDSESESCDSTISDDEMSHTKSPVMDDTNLFLAEVIDSLTRGFQEKLNCENLILEINSSRYAYNVTVREVNYNVIKAILNMPLQLSGGQPYLLCLCTLLKYFMPILVNYIRNDDAMDDCLQATEDVADTSSELNECVSKVLHWFYEKEVLSEESILSWFSKLEPTSRLRIKIQPFIKWLEEADEESDSDESE